MEQANQRRWPLYRIAEGPTHDTAATAYPPRHRPPRWLTAAGRVVGHGARPSCGRTPTPTAERARGGERRLARHRQRLPSPVGPPPVSRIRRGPAVPEPLVLDAAQRHRPRRGPGTPGYSAEGDQAGNNGNVAVSSNASATPRSHIDLWMSGPFHAIGILRSVTCSRPPSACAPARRTRPHGQWKSAATLDVVRGNNWGARSRQSPVVFPGNGATTSMTRFVAESPDPRTFCGWSGQQVGLPLIALMPSTVTRRMPR
jgi:hypothetical protein